MARSEEDKISFTTMENKKQFKRRLVVTDGEDMLERKYARMDLN